MNFKLEFVLLVAAACVGLNHSIDISGVMRPLFGSLVRPKPEPKPTEPPAPATLLPYQQVALNDINSFRATHGVRPLTWDSALATAALTCANTHAAASTLTPPCASNPPNTGEESAFSNNNSPPSQGVRAIINSQTGGQFGGWFGQMWAIDSDGDGFPDSKCIDWNPGPPVYNEACRGYTQAIWNSTTTVGCGFSDTTGNFPIWDGSTAPQHAFVCLFSPPGNIPATFAENVFEDQDRVPA